jgi:segregation and condensation protein B
LNAHYDRRGRAFRIVDVAGGYQLLTRPQLASWLRRLEYSPGEVRLSAPALETLAVIAYRQPVGRADIEAIRGVNCGEIIRQLMDRDLVKLGGRSAELGRPYLYITTKRFLQIFGLSNLEDLPRAAVVREAQVPAAADHESRVVLVDDTDKRSEEENEVSVMTLAALTWDEELPNSAAFPAADETVLPSAPVRAEDEDEDFEDGDDEDDDWDDDDDDEEDDLDEEEDELDEEDDLEEEEWEEVDDEDELEEEDDDEDDDWDDDDDLDDDEEEDDDWEDEE